MGGIGVFFCGEGGEGNTEAHNIPHSGEKPDTAPRGRCAMRDKSANRLVATGTGREVRGEGGVLLPPGPC